MKRTAKIECPNCHKQTKAVIKEEIPAMMHIPRRYKVVCSLKGCGRLFYVVADRADGS